VEARSPKTVNGCQGENIFKATGITRATNDAFTPDGFYKTGDIVVMLATLLKIVDRKKASCA